MLSAQRSQVLSGQVEPALARRRSRRMTANTSEVPASPEPAPTPTAPSRRRRTLGLALVLAAILAVGGVVGAGSASGASRYGASVESTIADIQSYWSQTLPSVYHTTYKAIPAD